MTNKKNAFFVPLATHSVRMARMAVAFFFFSRATRISSHIGSDERSAEKISVRIKIITKIGAGSGFAVCEHKLCVVWECIRRMISIEFPNVGIFLAFSSEWKKFLYDSIVSKLDAGLSNRIPHFVEYLLTSAAKWSGMAEATRKWF